MCGSWNFFCGRGKGPIFSANLNFRSGGGGVWNPLPYPPPLDPSMIYLHMKVFWQLSFVAVESRHGRLQDTHTYLVNTELSDFCNVVQYLPMEGFLTTFFCVSAAVTAGSFTELSVAGDAFVSSDIFKWYTEFPLQSLLWWEFSYNLDRGVKTIRKKKNEISLRWIRFISFLSEIF